MAKNNKSNSENENEQPEVPQETAKEITPTTVKYRNGNIMKMEVQLSSGMVTVLPQGVVEMPTEEYDGVKANLIGAWFKVND